MMEHFRVYNFCVHVPRSEFENPTKVRLVIRKRASALVEEIKVAWPAARSPTVGAENKRKWIVLIDVIASETHLH